MTEFCDNLLAKLNPLTELRVHVKNEIRLDGRAPRDHRKVIVQKSYITSPGTYGSALVKIGKTSAVCGINLMVGTPSMQAPTSGDIGKNQIGVF